MQFPALGHHSYDSNHKKGLCLRLVLLKKLKIQADENRIKNYSPIVYKHFTGL